MNTPSSDKIIIDAKINNLLRAKDYSKAASRLYNLQRKEWNLFYNNLSQLKSIKHKFFRINGFKISAQFNSKRLSSSSADVSSDAIKKRKCFLCLSNLPEKQKGFLISEEYILLCNPYPIFNRHFTIAHTKHKQQLIQNNFQDLLLISKKLAEDFVVFYNGGECGASAPDHLHFQAVKKTSLPIFHDLNFIKSKLARRITTNSSLAVHVISDGFRKFIMLESLNHHPIQNYFINIYSLLAKSNPDHSEPMMNVICSYSVNLGWTVLIFPRAKHRSSHYFREEKSKLLLSPASVDLGGVCILPRIKDYDKISLELIREIFCEIFPTDDEFSELTSNLEKLFIAH